MIEELLDKLEKVRSTGKDKWVACCPVHGDKNPSMSVAEKDGRVLCHCFACGANGLEVVQALSLPPSVLFEKPLERLAGYEEMKKAGKPLSYKDFKRVRLAKARLEELDSRFLEQNNINRTVYS